MQSGEWQPIETFPEELKDGTLVLFADDLLSLQGGVAAGWWDASNPSHPWAFIEGVGMYCDGCGVPMADKVAPNAFSADLPPDFWMPLPEAPTPEPSR